MLKFPLCIGVRTESVLSRNIFGCQLVGVDTVTVTGETVWMSEGVSWQLEGQWECPVPEMSGRH